MPSHRLAKTAAMLTLFSSQALKNDEQLFDFMGVGSIAEVNSTEIYSVKRRKFSSGAP
jgi:hypothetical protein